MPPAFLDLTVVRHFQSGVRSETYSIGAEGGSTFGSAGRGYRPTSSFSVRWDGDRLRIDTRTFPTPDPLAYTEHIEVWRLDEQGRLLMTVTDRGSESPGMTRTLIYRRQ